MILSNFLNFPSKSPIRFLWSDNNNTYLPTSINPVNTEVTRTSGGFFDIFLTRVKVLERRTSRRTGRQEMLESRLSGYNNDEWSPAGWGPLVHWYARAGRAQAGTRLAASDSRWESRCAGWKRSALKKWGQAAPAIRYLERRLMPSAGDARGRYLPLPGEYVRAREKERWDKSRFWLLRHMN